MPVPLPLPPVLLGGAVTEPASMGPPKPAAAIPATHAGERTSTGNCWWWWNHRRSASQALSSSDAAVSLHPPGPEEARHRHFPNRLRHESPSQHRSTEPEAVRQLRCPNRRMRDVRGKRPPLRLAAALSGFATAPAPNPGPRGLISRAICVGGGAITDGAGSVSRGCCLVDCSGAETGGGITATACEPGMGTKISRRGALGLGGTMAAFSDGVERILSRCASGVGGMTFAFNIGARCALSLRTSGVGATAASVIAGTRNEDFRPSAGAGPGIGLNASRLATAESDCGSFSLGASTTFSRSDSPRATRIVWVR